MRIVIVHGMAPFYPEALEDRPLGGTESFLILLHRQLRCLGHEVYMLTTGYEDPDEGWYRFDGSPDHHVFKDIGWCDVFFVTEVPVLYRARIKRRISILFSGSTWYNLSGNGDVYLRYYDYYTVWSPWQKHILSPLKKYKKDPNYLEIDFPFWLYMYESVDRPKRDPYRVIYTAQPDRGLHILLEMWEDILDVVPKANLHIYSSSAVYYPWLYRDDPEKAWEVVELVGSLPNVYVHKVVPKPELVLEYFKSKVFAYPCTYVGETCCSTVLESQAAGTPVATSKAFGLTKNAGSQVLIEPDKWIKRYPVFGKKYRRRFKGALIRLLTDEKFWATKSKEGQLYVKKFDWRVVTFRWIEKFSYRLRGKELRWPNCPS